MVLAVDIGVVDGFVDDVFWRKMHTCLGPDAVDFVEDALDVLFGQRGGKIKLSLGLHEMDTHGRNELILEAKFGQLFPGKQRTGKAEKQGNFFHAHWS